MERQPQKIRLELSPQAEKYARRDAPRDVRLAAARGALPLQPTEIATVLFALMHDEDAEVKSTARDSLEALPDGVLAAVLAAPAHPALLDHLARTFAQDEGRLEKIALNAATADRTVEFLAARPFRSVVEIVANNQQRLLRERRQQMAGTLSGVEMGLELAGVPHKSGGVQAALESLASSLKTETAAAR